MISNGMHPLMEKVKGRLRILSPVFGFHRNEGMKKETGIKKEPKKESTRESKQGKKEKCRKQRRN
jgi:hypothetical protein